MISFLVKWPFGKPCRFVVVLLPKPRAHFWSSSCACVMKCAPLSSETLTFGQGWRSTRIIRMHILIWGLIILVAIFVRMMEQDEKKNKTDYDQNAKFAIPRSSWRHPVIICTLRNLRSIIPESSWRHPSFILISHHMVKYLVFDILPLLPPPPPLILVSSCCQIRNWDHRE